MTQTMHEVEAPEDLGRRIETRYGRIALDPERQIELRPELIGFPGAIRFQLADIPDRAVPFKLLQSVDSPDLGVLVLPLDARTGPIARSELEKAGQRHGLDFERLVVLGVVTLRAEPGALHCSVNLRAPVLIDAGRRIGCQYVLEDEQYDLRHPLLLGSAPAAPKTLQAGGAVVGGAAETTDAG